MAISLGIYPTFSDKTIFPQCLSQDPLVWGSALVLYESHRRKWSQFLRKFATVKQTQIDILLSNFFWMIVRYTRGKFWMYLNVCFWLAVGICQFVHGKLWGATGAALLWTITQCLLSAPNISASSRKSSLLSTWTSKRLILNFKTVDGTKFDRPCYFQLEKVTKKACNSSISSLCCSTLISLISPLRQ